MDFRILGPLQVLTAGKPVRIPPGKQRALLAYLLLNANKIVSIERLVDALWGSAPPETAANALQVYVSQVRRAIEPDRARGAEPQVLVTHAPGYVLHVDPDSIDLHRFERLAEEGRLALAEEDFPRAADRLGEAVALWRGRALVDVPLESGGAAEAARLEDMRLAAVEDRLEAELGLGRAAEAVPALEELIIENPLRERLRGQLMLALYRLGRQADALAAYQDTRTTLMDELGLDPSPSLQRLERAILVQDEALEAVAVEPEPAAAPPPAESRRRITVAVCNVTAFTSTGEPLDPEAARSVQARSLDLVRRALERHGGTIENVDGQTIRALFGVAQAHEDDTLRAVRGATEAGRELEVLSRELELGYGIEIKARMGIETGVVLVAHQEVTGPPLTAAAGLAHEAKPDDILIGPGAEPIVRHAVRRRKAGSGRWRVLEVRADATPIARHLTRPLVGRVPELAELKAALERAIAQRTCVAATVVGNAGIGKSRLAHELRRRLGGDVAFLEGRCPPYGEGIAYSSLREILAGVPGADIEAIEGAGGPDEIALAARRVFESLADTRPVVVCFDDVHWAEASLLSLIAHVAERASGPILVLCLTRPELAEDGLPWTGEILALDPLAPSDSQALIAELAPEQDVGGEVRARIAEAAEGNPLFIEQMLLAVREEGHVAVPPTIEALLAARLDLLDRPARELLERGAVVGRTFEQAAVLELSSEDTAGAFDALSDVLVRRQLLAPAGDSSFRFAHDLIREVCYEGILKATRSRLHERFAAFLERDSPDTPGLDGTIGFHLEQAHRWLGEAEPGAEPLPDLAARAALWLEAAGRRAYASGDVPAATGLLRRAAALLPEGTRRAELLLALAGAIRETGDFARAQEVLADAERLAATLGDVRLERQADVLRVRIEIATEPSIDATELLARAQKAIADLEPLEDHHGLAEAWTAVAWLRWIRCRAAETEGALQEALAHAHRAGDERLISLNLNLFLGAGLFGPLPVSKAIERCEEILRDSPGARLEAAAYRALGGLSAMQGEFDAARDFLERDRSIIEERGLVLAASATAETWGIVELLAGRPAEAERRLRSGYELLEPTGEKSELSTLAAVLAEAVFARGHLAEALDLTVFSERAAAPDDLTTQVQWRGVKAKVLAARRELPEAEALAREAVTLAAETDFLNLRGEALLNLAEVLDKLGSADERADVVETAVTLFEQKENLVAAERVRGMLSAVAASHARGRRS